jgi:hypothetical protein
MPDSSSPSVDAGTPGACPEIFRDTGQQCEKPAPGMSGNAGSELWERARQLVAETEETP